MRRKVKYFSKGSLTKVNSGLLWLPQKELPTVCRDFRRKLFIMC